MHLGSITVLEENIYLYVAERLHWIAFVSLLFPFKYCNAPETLHDNPLIPNLLFPLLMTQRLYKGHISLTTAFPEEICLADTYPSSARRICNMYWVTGRSNMLGDRSPLLGSVFQTSPEICPLIIYPISCVALYLLNLLGRTP